MELADGFRILPIDIEAATDKELENWSRLRRLVAVEYGARVAQDSLPQVALVRRGVAIRFDLGYDTRIVLLCRDDVVCGYAEYCVDACMPTLLKREGRAVSHEARGLSAARGLLAIEALVAHSNSHLTTLMTTGHATLAPEDLLPANHMIESSWRVAV